MPLFLPSKLELRSIHEEWRVHYEPTWSAQFSLQRVAPYEILVRGRTAKRKQCYEVLATFLKRKASRHLKEWIRALAEEYEFPVNKVTIRGQKTIWGSCSETGTINLNYKLLFLSAPLVEYILIHEMCHLKELNHSKKFWSLVEELDPHYRDHRKILTENTRKLLPWWVEF